MILADQATAVDLLNNEAISSTITSLLSSRSNYPITIGIHGDWGAGKSSIIEMLETSLKKDKKILCLTFNGWRFQGFEDAKIALLEGIVDGLLQARPNTEKVKQKAQELFKRIDWLKLARKGGSLAWNLTTGLPSLDQLQSLVSSLEGLVGNSEAIEPKKVGSLLKEAKGLLKNAPTKQVPTEIRAFQKEFDQLLKAADVEQLVVLIDDLDRCLPDTAIETLEAIRLFVFTSRTAFIIAADEAMIEYAVRKHFPELPETTGPHNYARNYLEKLVQVPVRIPALGVTETRNYVTLLLIGNILGEDHEAFRELISLAREQMRRPWLNQTLGQEDIQQCVSALEEEQKQQVQAAFQVSAQIGSILAEGTQGNPRQIKRFLNALLLRYRIAVERGFSDSVQQPILAKLMLAERFQPALFDELALISGSSSDGKIPALSPFENPLVEEQPQGKDTKKGKASAKDSATNPVVERLGKWSLQVWVSKWLETPPRLAEVDLRPYFFVVKTSREFLSTNQLPPYLQEIASKLMGNKLMAQVIKEQLEALSSTDHEKLFQYVKDLILRTGNLRTQPNGIEGIKMLVKINTDLEPALLDLLELLPSDRLGAWVVNGWGTLRQPGTKARFQQLTLSWSEHKSNKILSSAASVASGSGKNGAS